MIHRIEIAMALCCCEFRRKSTTTAGGAALSFWSLEEVITAIVDFKKSIGMMDTAKARSVPGPSAKSQYLILYFVHPNLRRDIEPVHIYHSIFPFSFEGYARGEGGIPVSIPWYIVATPPASTESIQCSIILRSSSFFCKNTQDYPSERTPLV